jgi:pyrroline-5-carboxylate reductase
LVRVGFIGCDDTAAVLARGWGEPVLCADADWGRARGLAAQLGGHALTSYDAVARWAEIVLLCHERAHLDEIAASVSPHACIVVSTLGTTPLDAVRQAYPNRPVYRVTVNRPAQIRRGVIALAEGPPQSADTTVRSLFARLGRVIVMDDALIDAAAAIMSDSEALVEARARDSEGRAALEQLAAFPHGPLASDVTPHPREQPPRRRARHC